jgi:hypothetical protein
LTEAWVNQPVGGKTYRPLFVEVSDNVLGGKLHFSQFPAFLAEDTVLSTGESEKLLTKLVEWSESRNLYLLPADKHLLEHAAAGANGQSTLAPSVRPTKTLADWKNFWGLGKLNSERGLAKFHGGDLIARAKLTPLLLAPGDFRLCSDSPGRGAGPGGKDLGADVDLVGPGKAYETWKKTPAYQQWHHLLALPVLPMKSGPE